MIFGQPMEFSRYYGRERDREALRAVTDEIIAEIAKLSGQEYVNIYAKQAKERARRIGRIRIHRCYRLHHQAFSGPIARGLRTARLCLMRVGVLNGGGDCPGLDAVYRAVVRRGTQDTGSSSSDSVTAGGGRLKRTRCRST